MVHDVSEMESKAFHILCMQNRAKLYPILNVRIQYYTMFGFHFLKVEIWHYPGGKSL